MNELEKCCYKEVCKPDKCLFETPYLVRECKIYQEFIMRERLGKFREAEGLDYQELTEKYENGER